MASFINKKITLQNAFKIKGFHETLPAGKYDIEISEHCSQNSKTQKKHLSSVILHLHPCTSNPGLKRSIHLPLVEFEAVLSKDEVTLKKSKDPFLEAMMADPFIHLIMQADGYSETEVRNLHAPC
ncbi:hypothetical protein OE810_02325 [Rhodobacteraceae bacterium XHP0102]|nr:hypothetical protein [Rhodobacteraceae bacterium XHP0102]